MFRWAAVGAVLLLVLLGALLARPAPESFYASQVNRLVAKGKLDAFSSLEVAGAPDGFTERLRPTPGKPSLTGTLRREGLSIGSVWIPAPTPWVVLPPLVAVLLAILFRKVLLCLAAGVLVGAWVFAGTPAGALEHAAVHVLWDTVLKSTFNLYIFGFVVFLSMAVGIAHANGGIQGILERLVRFCRSARATRVGTACAGLLIFFDDYLNTIIVGNTMRPLTDRFRVSREKLAYIVDSTAAPVAGIALISTWIAYEVTTLQTALDGTTATVSAYSLFLDTLPYRFYCIFTLVFVLLNAWSGRDYGPMLRAERRAAQTGDVGGPPDPGRRDDGKPRRALNGVLPIAVTFMVCGYFLWALRDPKHVSDIEAHRGTIWEALETTDSAQAFCWGSLAGLVTSLLLTAVQRLLKVRETLRAMLISTRAVAPALAILLLAWSIAEVCLELGTGPYLVSLLGESLPMWLVPLLLFLLSGLTAFSTGSSWSTMAILIPVGIPLAYEIGGLPLLVLSAGAVLEGSIFGDHCSPISDTTVLSSTASLCPHHAHVRTQIPYALTTFGVAFVCGYLPAALGLPVWTCWAAGVAALILILARFGCPTEVPVPTGAAGRDED
ncbi:MAG: Na+/H+ antiporter NhaC family protein [Planctomycetota bacterium]|nr:Na+/H+ antiporter NhaC family protein [Planctomycetota bacterium]